KQYCQLSTGQKRRLHLALALIGDPDILFLDEPTAGLDVEGRIALHNQIRRLKELGKTIILASHDMAEIEALCSRIAILNHGCIAFLGTVDELTEEVGTQYNIEIITECGKDDYTVDDIGESLPAILEQYKSKSLTILDIKINRGS
ncbi:ATP-binding cassette domain-containing protein, partial [Intestinibacillus massiliensis]|nr:ATP-binding cassette domain-containing protein [Intestinibacillus massiliensis]